VGAFGIVLSGCAGAGIVEDDEDAVTAELSVPTRVKVNGRIVDVESNYLPRVVQCENPGAPYESLKAQAIAARTYLTYRSDNKVLPSIRDGESDQVYTCPANSNGRFVSDDVKRAVQETARQVVTWDGKITAGFFVAGASRAAESCKRLSDPTDTEHWITYNGGQTDETSHQDSPIGYRGDYHNRGCFGQRMANCLADSTPLDHAALLRYFYGADVLIGTIDLPVLTADQIARQVAVDLEQSLCWSNTLDRPVPRGSCVQSLADRKWYQCSTGGEWKDGLLVAADGRRAGVEGRCTLEIDL
jgi:hypothetical protein